MMRYMVQPRSVFEVPRRGPRYDNEAPIRIDNPTDRAIMVTIHEPEVVAAESGDLINRWLATPTPEWLTNPRRFSEAAEPTPTVFDGLTRTITTIESPPQSPDMAEMIRAQQQLIARTCGVSPRFFEQHVPAVRETAEQAIVRQEASFWTRAAAAPTPPLMATDLERAYNRFVENPVPTLEQQQIVQNLERQMQQRNFERWHEQARRDIFEYQAHLGRPDAGSHATARSLKLLREHLSPEQLTAWDRDGYFAVKGNVSGGIYHLTIGGVQRTSDGHEFCLQLVGDEWTPLYDAVLARKILLECDETKFLATANNLTVGNPGRQRQLPLNHPGYAIPTVAEIHALNERTNSQMRRLDAQLNRGFTERMVAATARLFGGTGD